jgi:ParB family chromosome partitioning protein
MDKKMTTKRKGLGRSLGSLLGPQNPILSEIEPIAANASGNNTEEAVVTPEVSLQDVSVELVHASRYQPRREFDETALHELSESIKAQGIIQPIVVRERAGGGFEIIAGERRFRAAQMAGLTQVPVVVRKIDDQTALAMALVENLQRQDLNPIEEALALQRLTQEFSLTHQTLSEIVGKSRTAITNMLRLLTLSHEVKELLEIRKLDIGHAKVLLGLPTELQPRVARVIAEKKLSVRETEDFIKKLMMQEVDLDEKFTYKEIDPNIRSLQTSLSEKLGAAVEIRHQNQRGNGALVIKYNSLDELDGILEHIK